MPIRFFSFLRPLLSGLAGGVAWFAGIFIFFIPAQSILADPARQSAKMMGAFGAEPLPRMGAAPWILPVGLLAIGALWGFIYRWIAPAWPECWWRRGLRFALLTWAILIPWFEFYLPWNVLLEPAPLVLLECVLWAGVMLLVGLTIAGTDALLGRLGKRGTAGRAAGG